MNIKEYLQTNNSPLFENPKNILILEWLEANAFCTPIEISKNTHILLQEVNEILQILYKNSLISFNEDKYAISSKGIELLNKLGFSDLQITNLLNQTDFKKDEYLIYKSIFETWRSQFLNYYLVMSNIIKNQCDNICLPYFSKTEVPKKKSYTSMFIVTLLHELAHVLYTDENSLLMNYYTALYDYSFLHYCTSSEIYHSESKYWKTDNNKNQFSAYIRNTLRKGFTTAFLYLTTPKTEIDDKNLVLNEIYKIYHLNQDFALSHKISANNELLNNIFICNDIKQLSATLHLTESQTKFILKSIRSKIDILLPSETDTTY